jgi:hypothetical protein
LFSLSLLSDRVKKKKRKVRERRKFRDEKVEFKISTTHVWSFKSWFFLLTFEFLAFTSGLQYKLNEIMSPISTFMGTPKNKLLK